MSQDSVSSQDSTSSTCSISVPLRRSTRLADKEACIKRRRRNSQRLRLRRAFRLMTSVQQGTALKAALAGGSKRRRRRRKGRRQARWRNTGKCLGSSKTGGRCTDHYNTRTCSRYLRHRHRVDIAMVGVLQRISTSRVHRAGEGFGVRYPRTHCGEAGVACDGGADVGGDDGQSGKYYDVCGCRHRSTNCDGGAA